MSHSRIIIVYSLLQVGIKMLKRHLKRSGRDVLVKIAMFSIFILLFYCAIKVGIMGGDYLYKNDFQIVKRIDVEKFKRVLDTSLPLIDVTYNSGSIGNPFTAQIRRIIRMFSGFDLNSPVTILNAQASYFYVYYKNTYIPLLALDDKIEKDENINSADNGTGNTNQEYQNSRGIWIEKMMGELIEELQEKQQKEKYREYQTHQIC